MISRTESREILYCLDSVCLTVHAGVQNWLENITYQMCNMSYKQQASKLAGYVDSSAARRPFANALDRQIAFLKSYSTSCAQDTARDAVQIFGGRGVTKSGMGRHIEHVGCFRVSPVDSFLINSNSITGLSLSIPCSGVPRMF
jgi:hypothetical protein